MFAMVGHLCPLCGRYTRIRFQAIQIFNGSIQVLRGRDVSPDPRHIFMRLDEVSWSTGTFRHGQLSAPTPVRGCG
jgi:hypothetical protein